LSPATAQLPSRPRSADTRTRLALRRYPSDTSDAEWQILAGYIPVGGPVTYPRRDIVDAIRHVDHNSCVWRALPVDFPPWPTVYHYFRTWNRDGTLTALHGGLREQVRQAEGRHAEPSAAILDSQSVRAAETVARSSRGYDAGKKVNGRKRHIAVDTTGLLLVVLVTGTGVQDRHGARRCCGPWPAASPASAWSGSTAATAAYPSTTASLWAWSCRWSPSWPARSGSPCCHAGGS
jgi:transposase